MKSSVKATVFVSGEWGKFRSGSTVRQKETIVAGNGDNLSPNLAKVAENGSRQCGQGFGEQNKRLAA